MTARLTPMEIIGFSEPDPAARFYFDNGTTEPSAREFGALIMQSYVAMLESWREAIEDGIDAPPRSLVALFDEAGVPLWEHDDESNVSDAG